MPHGVIVLDHTIERNLNSTQREQCNILKREQERVGFIVSDIKPDLIFLSTPHGISEQNNFGLYVNLNAKG